MYNRFLLLRELDSFLQIFTEDTKEENLLQYLLKPTSTIKLSLLSELLRVVLRENKT